MAVFISLVCETCKKDFVTYKREKTRPAQRFCSRICYGKILAIWKDCPGCKKRFYNWNNGKYCSMKCVSIDKTGKKLPEHHRKALLGAPKPNSTDEKHNNWKGDDVGYGSLHSWIRRKKGKPKECEGCGRDDGMLHWANASGNYLRDLDDWIPLCPKCHKAHDRGSLPLNRTWEVTKINGHARIGRRLYAKS